MNNTMTTINEQIISLTGQGVSQRKIAEQLSVSVDKVRYVLKKAGMVGKRHNKSCGQCKKSFQSHSVHAKFCSESCRGKYNKKHKGHKQECIWCKTEIVSYHEKKYCSDICLSEHAEWRGSVRKLARLIATMSDCLYCGDRLLGRKKYCNNECRYKHSYQKEKAAKEKYVKVCNECGCTYHTTRPKAVYCSDECGRRYNNRMSEIRRREVISRNGKIDWDINLQRLIKRDKGLCHLCDGEVNTEVHSNHDYYPSVDHVVPISKGGTHTWDNIKLAHRICNSIKADNV